MKSKIISLAIAILAIFNAVAFAQKTPNIVGAWKLVGQKIILPDGGVKTTDSAYLNQIKVYTNNTFVNVGERNIPELDNQKYVVSCAGGHYSLVGDVYQEFTEFANWRGYKDMKVKFQLTMENGKMHTVGGIPNSDGTVTSYDEWYSKVDMPVQSKELTGTWKAVAQKVGRPDGSVLTTDSASTHLRKLFTPGMVVVINERIVPEANNEKLVVSVAGGKYTLKNGEYVELMSFGSYKDFDKLDIKFNLKIDGKKLHTVGAITYPGGGVVNYDESFVKED